MQQTNNKSKLSCLIAQNKKLKENLSKINHQINKESGIYALQYLNRIMANTIWEANISNEHYVMISHYLSESDDLLLNKLAEFSISFLFNQYQAYINNTYHFGNPKQRIDIYVPINKIEDFIKNYNIRFIVKQSNAQKKLMQLQTE